MNPAAKRKSILAAWLCALIVVLCPGETRAREIFDAPQPASGQIQAASPEGVGENYDASAYDAPGYAVAPKGGGFVRFRSDYADHLRLRDMSVKRSNGIGGAHNLDEFNRHAGDLSIVSRTAHPTQPGISRIEYQIPALDRAGNPTGAFKAQVFSKTVYDPSVISDGVFATWGRQAAAEAQAAGRLAREWIGTAPNGLRFRGYLDHSGAVRSFFPDF